ncbi:MAG TPA: TetR/AcrR family transcriptional regulator [Labilithrix sp.]|jgi:TetR/AcrR family transcriptional repressor of nem operon|nr:TetR/AcrR family transcriptional regulator [Labilithrix sp.]
MNAKVEQKERTHAAIIESACKLVRQKGIGGARVADVMSGVGLTVGGFYAHFASKETLVDEAIRRTAAFMRRRLFDRIEEKPLAVRAEVVLKRYLSAAHRDDPANGCPMPSIVGEVSTTAPEHRDVLAEQISDLAEELATHVSKGDGSSKRATALGMVALMYGGISLARAVKGTELSDEILRSCRAVGKGER